MYCTAPAPFARQTAITAQLFPDLQRLRRALCNMVFATLLLICAAMVLHAEEMHPDWLPQEVQLPADMDVLMDREIGSSLRMFSFSTEGDVAALLVEWEAALQQGGYTIDQSRQDGLDQVIEFSGNDINNAKIVIPPSTDEGRSVIEFDATLK